MGRGRAKAKQTKVARQLKYSSGMTDLERLQAELAAERGSGLQEGDGGTDVVGEADGEDQGASGQDVFRHFCAPSPRKSGSATFRPSCIADSCAQIPAQVQFTD